MFDEVKELKYFKETKGLKSVKVKAEAYLQPSRESGAFSQKYTAACSYFCKKILIIDVWVGSKYASYENEIFKMKLRFDKQSWLLQRVAFLVIFNVRFSEGFWLMQHFTLNEIFVLKQYALNATLETVAYEWFTK